MQEKPTLKTWMKAWIQWITLFLLTVVGTLVGLLLVQPLIIVALKIKYQMFCRQAPNNPFGESIVEHSDHYMDAGSSGFWEFWSVNPSWHNGNFLQFFIWLFGNDEDGFLGEPNGKHSARRNGKERSFLSMWLWCLRNPFNNAKRYWSLMRCEVDFCHIRWGGDGEARDTYGNVLLNDDDPLKTGWYFVEATDKRTGKKYYGFREVRHIGWHKIEKNQTQKMKKVKHFIFGFKVKPKHAYEKQNEDDQVKGFTFRLTWWAKAN